MSAQPTPSPQPAAAPAESTVKRRRWILVGIAAFFLLFALVNAIDPFGDKGYVGISHGDHTHYVPEDRDPNVSISNFPSEPPGPNERILPDGRVVPRN
jgi:hypothetical protein